MKPGKGHPLPSKQEEGNPDVVTDRLDFWAKYDALTDTFDRAMVERLDRNLDVLLIFVSALSVTYSS